MSDLAIVGSSLRRAPRERIGWTVFAAAIIAADLTMAATRPLWERMVLAILGALALGALAARPEHGADAVGLRLVPARGVVHWLKVTLVLGVIFVALLFVVPWILRACGVAMTSPAWTHDRARLVSRLISQGWLYPFHEEVIYRLVLVGALAAWFRPWVTIVLGTIAFAALHWLYGNPAPDNQLAGFVLVWAFLSSRSLFVPIVLHSLGNLCGIAVGLVAY